MTDMTPTTVAAFRRAMVPGTRIHIDNRRHPHISRDTVVLARTDTVNLVTEAPGAPHGSFLSWPKKGGVIHDGAATWGLLFDGAVWLTITVLDPE